MSGSIQPLDVFLGETRIATIALTDDQLCWQYTEVWIAQGFSISPHLSISKPCKPVSASRFLRNLLPEGDGLEEISLLYQISKSNTFALIRSLGQDLPGAVMIKDPREPFQHETAIRLVSQAELIERLDNRQVRGLVVWDNKPRLSSAGIQDKLNVFVNEAGEIGFAEGRLCSTHILKFERQHKVHLVINEYLTMSLAKACGLNVAEVALKQFGEHRALLVKRFDRKKMSDEHVKRMHIIDGCQALDLPPDYKYERNLGKGRDVAEIREGASLPKLFQFARACQNPAATKLSLLRWVLFNCLVYNFDAHGKNISFFVGKDGYFLAPFYDIVNIALYPEFEQDLAMALGDEFDGHIVNAYQLADFAESCDIPRRLLQKELLKLIASVEANLPERMPELTSEENDYLKQYTDLVQNRCQHLADEAALIASIEL